MLKSVDNIDKILFSKEFICNFKRAIKEFYNYEEYMDFLIVPSIFGGKALSYLPILSYTDRNSSDIIDLLELSKESEYQIRVLNFDYKNFRDGDTVTMRINIDGRSSDEILMENMKSKYRKVIKNSIKKNDFTFVFGNSRKFIEDFYLVYSDIMYKHGTPPLDEKFFFELSRKLLECVLFYNVYDNENIIASYCVFIDSNLAYGAWGGADDRYRDRLLGHFAYWNIIKDLADNRKIKVFDFGRSPFGSGGYVFKHRFGARAVKVEIISSQESDIYSKYSLASSIWKRLPRKITDLAGPKLCKYLVDL